MASIVARLYNVCDICWNISNNNVGCKDSMVRSNDLVNIVLFLSNFAFLR